MQKEKNVWKTKIFKVQIKRTQTRKRKLEFVKNYFPSVQLKNNRVS